MLIRATGSAVTHHRLSSIVFEPSAIWTVPAACRPLSSASVAGLELTRSTDQRLSSYPFVLIAHTTTGFVVFKNGFAPLSGRP